MKSPGSKLMFFYRVIDIITTQLSERFKSLQHVNDKFNFLNPTEFINLKTDEILEKGKNLQAFYNKDISDDFCFELVTLRNNRLLCDDLKKISSVFQFLEYLLVSKPTGASSFPNVDQRQCRKIIFEIENNKKLSSKQYVSGTIR